MEPLALGFQLRGLVRRAFHVRHDGRVLSGSDDGTLRVWNLTTGEGRALTGHKGWVSGALLLPDGRPLIWSTDRSIRIRYVNGDDSWWLEMSNTG